MVFGPFTKCCNWSLVCCQTKVMPMVGLREEDGGPIVNVPFEEPKRLASQFRVYVLTSAAIPTLLAVLVWRIRAERLDHFGEVEYGVPDAANGTRKNGNEVCECEKGSAEVPWERLTSCEAFIGRHESERDGLAEEVGSPADARLADLRA